MGNVHAVKQPGRAVYCLVNFEYLVCFKHDSYKSTCTMSHLSGAAAPTVRRRDFNYIFLKKVTPLNGLLPLQSAGNYVLPRLIPLCCLLDRVGQTCYHLLHQVIGS